MVAETELEYKIVGSVLLLDAPERQRIFASVSVDFFSDSTAKCIFKKLSALCADYPQADYTVLAAALKKNEQTAAVLAMQSMISPSIAENQLDDTLKAAKELYARRRIKKEVTELALESDISVNDLRQLVTSAENLTEEHTETSGEKYLRQYHEPIKLVQTGFPVLDETLGGGLLAGTLSSIGARPSTGKTTYAINIAAHNPDRKVMFFSIEMSSGMIYDRLIADTADLDYSLTGRHSISVETVKAVIERYKNLTVVDDVSKVEKITDMIYTEKPDIVIIDFIQIVTSSRKFVDNRQRIDYISQMLKQAAKATGCCIITLSQLTRAGKDKPTMSDLKESGGLEQDSDYVLLLYRPYVNDKSGSEADPKDTTVTLDKNKFGSTREFKYEFDGRKQRFTELPDSKDEIKLPVKHENTADGIDEDLPF